MNLIFTEHVSPGLEFHFATQTQHTWCVFVGDPGVSHSVYALALSSDEKSLKNDLEVGDGSHRVRVIILTRCCLLQFRKQKSRKREGGAEGKGEQPLIAYDRCTYDTSYI